MILADTTVWIHHIHRSRADLVEYLMEGRVLSHPFLIGELACGRIRGREELLAALCALPAARLSSHEEAISMVDRHSLAGRGLGWVDVHLLAAARLSGALLLTDDRALRAAAQDLGIAA